MIEVHFSPDGGCTKAVTDLLDTAEKSVLVMAYSFTSRPILDALAGAVKRGVIVRLVADERSNSGKVGFAATPEPRSLDWYVALDASVGSLFAEAIASGIEGWLDPIHAIMHDKVMVIDGRYVVTGSFNWSDNAEHHNAENLLIIDDPDLSAFYAANWELHRSHSRKP